MDNSSTSIWNFKFNGRVFIERLSGHLTTSIPTWNPSAKLTDTLICKAEKKAAQGKYQDAYPIGTTLAISADFRGIRPWMFIEDPF